MKCANSSISLHFDVSICRLSTLSQFKEHKELAAVVFRRASCLSALQKSIPVVRFCARLIDSLTQLSSESKISANNAKREIHFPAALLGWSSAAARWFIDCCRRRRSTFERGDFSKFPPSHWRPNLDLWMASPLLYMWVTHKRKIELRNAF